MAIVNSYVYFRLTSIQTYPKLNLVGFYIKGIVEPQHHLFVAKIKAFRTRTLLYIWMFILLSNTKIVSSSESAIEYPPFIIASVLP